ncbi:MAG: hypothetical protein HY305_00625 [Sphingobacteriales bacterium]|nr:hypothetical protein [Sphingobacteriales bacterium]
MSDEIEDILSNNDKNFNNQELLAYLNSQLPKEQQHELEKHMADDVFLNDAVEGLQNLKDIQPNIDELNKELRNKLAKHKKRKEKQRLKGQPYTYIGIFIILSLLVITYIILNKLR